MKSKLICVALLMLAGLSSCLKEYSCECVKTNYVNYVPTGTPEKVENHYNGSRRSMVRSECHRMQDSVIENGTGWTRRCELKD